MKSWILCMLMFLPTWSLAQYSQKATNTEENVKNKLFPKGGRFEISAPAFGLILNQSYIDSYLVHGAMTYFINESWGLSLEAAWLKNTDKEERYCIEHFYNDPYGKVPEDCPSRGQDGKAQLKDPSGTPYRGANFGPAYVAIRELTSLFFASAIWNPIYGKQLAFLSFTSYFDIFTTLGAGVATSIFYPDSSFLRDGTISRGPVAADSTEICPQKVGVCPSNANVDQLIGAAGRPDAQHEVNPVLTIGLGQKLHFAHRYHISAEVRNFTLFGGPTGYETYFALWAGLGVRF